MAFNEYRSERSYAAAYGKKTEGPVEVGLGDRYAGYAWAGLRILLGWVFAWAFVDKLFGLGFATKPENAWIAGGSPTFGFLNFGSHGPFAGVFKAMAGNPVVDALFMVGLAALGVALLSGIGVRVAAVAGSVLLALMHLAAIPPENNPVVDDHVVYIVALIGVAAANAGRVFGLGRRWEALPFVRKHRWMV